MRVALAFTLIWMLAAPAYADMAAARAAYASGAYADAAREGEAQADAPGMALAAHALLSDILSAPRADAPDKLARATRDAQRALDLDKGSIDAHLNLALALGLQGARASAGEAWRKGYAQRGKRLIDEALALAPNEPRALALLGGWHLEVLRRAGGGAGILGARYETGVAAFDRAHAAAPDDPAIALHYAVALLALDPHKHAAQASALLASAAAATPSDAFTGTMRQAARQLGSLLATQGATAAAAEINRRYL